FDRLSAELIVVKFKDRQSSSLVPGHGDGIDHVRLGSEQANFEAGRERESFLCFFRGQRGCRGRSMRTGKLATGRLVSIDRKIKRPSLWHLNRSRIRRQSEGEKTAQLESERGFHGTINGGIRWTVKLLVRSRPTAQNRQHDEANMRDSALRNRGDTLQRCITDPPSPCILPGRFARKRESKRETPYVTPL